MTDKAATRIQAVASDSYGTLFDVDSLAALAEKLYPGKGEDFFFELTADKRQQLLAQYQRLDAFPDVVGAMHEFRQLRIPLAIVSNGTPEMLRSAVKHAGIEGMLDRLVSVDTVKAYKTDSRIYLAGAKVLNMSPQNICFVSSHSWDVIGAMMVGYGGFWVNRNDDPVEELGVPVPNRGTTLNDAAQFVKRSRA